MTTTFSNDSNLLQNLLNKIIRYRFTRNIDRELENRKISHAELSRSCGRNENWYNRSFNNLEDMKITTLVKLVAAVTKISDQKAKHEPFNINSVLDEELVVIASVLIDLKENNLKEILHPDANMMEFFLKIKVYVNSMKNLVTQEESDAYFRILEQITKKEIKKNG